MVADERAESRARRRPIDFRPPAIEHRLDEVRQQAEADTQNASRSRKFICVS